VRIERIDLKAFGRFTDATLDFGASDGCVHVVFGPNESGKSTSLRAITALLFGIDVRSTDNYVHPYARMRVGGRLVCDRHGVIECVRRKGNKRTLKTSDESADADQRLLSRMLGGMDQETFIRGFGLDRQRLIEGGRDIMRGEGDLGKILFSAGVGVRNLHEVSAALEKEKREIFLAGGSVPLLNRTLAELKQLRTELQQQSLSHVELGNRRTALAEARQTASELGDQLSALRREAARCQQMSRAIPLGQRRREILSALAPLEGVPAIDDAFRVARREAESQQQIADTQIEMLKSRLTELESEHRNIPCDESILAISQRLESLTELAIRCRTGESQMPELEASQIALQAEIKQLLTSLDRPASTDIASLQLSELEQSEIQSLGDEGLRLRQAVDSTRALAQQLGQRLAKVQRSLDQIDDAVCEPKELAAAMAAYGNPRTLLDQHTAALGKLQRQQRKLTTAWENLIGYRGTLETARQINLPLEATTSGRGKEFDAAVKRLEEQRDHCDRAQSRLQAQRAEVAALVSAGDVPNEQELAAARRERDDRWDALRRAPADSWKRDTLIDQLDQLGAAVRNADQVVDAMRSAADRVARRLQCESEVVRLTQEVEAAQQRVTQAEQVVATAESAWREIWEAIDVDPGSPAEMAQWRNRFETFAEIADQHDECARDLARCDQQIDRCRNVIGEAMRSMGEEISEEHDLLVLHARASDVLDESSRRFQQRTELDVERLRLGDELGDAQGVLQQLESDLSAWQRRWEQATTRVTQGKSAQPEQVRQLVRTMDSLRDRHEKLAVNQRQLQELRRELSRFESESRELGQEILDPDHQPQDPFQIVEELKRLWRQHDAGAKQRAALENEISKCRTQLDAAQQNRSIHRAKLETLAREIGCAKIDDLPAKEQQSFEKQTLEADLKNLHVELQTLAGNQEVGDFCRQILQMQPDQLADQALRIGQQIESIEPRWEQAQQQLGARQELFDAMDGSDRAATINQRIQALEARAARLARQYGTLALQDAALKRAIEVYRERNQGPILARATEFFRELTGGAYRVLKPYLDEKNVRVLVGVRDADGTEVNANLMSEGTADALFLALRLAGLETHCAEHGPMPLVIDDVLVQFDDSRSAAALRLLASMAATTQVIFFTHHGHLIDLVKQHLRPEQYKLHDLTRIGS
jgi:uncharacterized protein YhaN